MKLYSQLLTEEFKNLPSFAKVLEAVDIAILALDELVSLEERLAIFDVFDVMDITSISQEFWIMIKKSRGFELQKSKILGTRIIKFEDWVDEEERNELIKTFGLTYENVGSFYVPYGDNKKAPVSLVSRKKLTLIDLFYKEVDGEEGTESEISIMGGM